MSVHIEINDFEPTEKVSPDSESAAMDFGEDLRTLVEVSEVRGCRPKDMGEAMIGCGLQVMKEGCRDVNHTLMVAEAIMDEWEAFHHAKKKRETVIDEVIFLSPSLNSPGSGLALSSHPVFIFLDGYQILSQSSNRL